MQENPARFLEFQSLSRDSGRLNVCRLNREKRENPVSIPQSGFGAFEPGGAGDSGPGRLAFQSLSRDSGRLNVILGHQFSTERGGFNPSVGIRGV